MTKRFVAMLVVGLLTVGAMPAQAGPMRTVETKKSGTLDGYDLYSHDCDPATDDLDEDYVSLDYRLEYSYRILTSVEKGFLGKAKRARIAFDAKVTGTLDDGRTFTGSGSSALARALEPPYRKTRLPIQVHMSIANAGPIPAHVANLVFDHLGYVKSGWDLKRSYELFDDATFTRLSCEVLPGVTTQPAPAPSPTTSAPSPDPTASDADEETDEADEEEKDDEDQPEEDESDGGCDPSYPDVCIPPPPPDLNCSDVADEDFTVVGSDPHGFDGDNDGIGCET